jgi:hypothetical protein
MAKKTREDQGIVYNCSSYLRQRWEEVVRSFQETSPDIPSDPLSEGHSLIPLIRACLQSPSLTYHYVLPTQLLAKAVNPSLDAHATQASYHSPGAFDARTIAHDVIVPFDRENERVLGGSPEPYVNNPLRVSGITADYRNAQKQKTDWDKLVAVLALWKPVKTNVSYDLPLIKSCMRFIGCWRTSPLSILHLTASVSTRQTNLSSNTWRFGLAANAWKPSALLCFAQ